jgi:hypothetical protein
MCNPYRIANEDDKMTENQTPPTRFHRYEESVISAISVGGVFILIGLVYVLTLPNSLWDKTIAFFNSFTTKQVSGTGIFLPAPASPSAHVVFYSAVFQFFLGLVLLQILILAMRLIWRSPVRRISETAGTLVFWLGASYLVSAFLNRSTTVDMWFEFWAALLMVLGVSLLARALVILIRRQFSL